MADREAAERAVKDANPIIDGRKSNVNLAYLGAKPRNNNPQTNGQYYINIIFSFSLYVHIHIFIFTCHRLLYFTNILLSFSKQTHTSCEFPFPEVRRERGLNHHS